MSEQEYKQFQAVLQKKLQEVKTSKVAARKLLTDLGMLTPKGNLKKSFKAAE